MRINWLLVASLAIGCGRLGYDPDGSENRPDASPTTDAATPQATCDETTLFSRVVAGHRHTCAITTAGALWCWGHNSDGQLGDGTTTDRWLPVRLSTPVNVIDIALGDAFTCALTADRQLTCFGRGGMLGDGTNDASPAPVPVQVPNDLGDIAEISAGYGHACLRTSGGNIACWGSNGWGRNRNGQVGDGTQVGRRAPTPVVNLNNSSLLVSGGGSHTCAWTPGAAAECWGHNGHGQLGNGTTGSSLIPDPVSSLTDIVQVASLTTATCALRGDGRVFCWGANDTASGQVYCWGENHAGELGDGTTASRPLPALVPGLTDVAQFAAGLNHVCALSSDSSVRCWGGDAFGELGVGSPPTAAPARACQ